MIKEVIKEVIKEQEKENIKEQEKEIIKKLGQEIMTYGRGDESELCSRVKLVQD